MADMLIIGIAGGSGSGKSTIARLIAEKFGDDVTVLRHDDYYKAQHDLTLEELREFSDKVGEDVYDSLTLEGSIASRNHTGGTAPSQVAKQVGIWKERLKNRAHK